MKVFLFFVFLIVAGCNSSGKNSIEASADSIKGDSLKAKAAPPKPMFRPLTNKKDMTGIWAADDKEILTVKIDDDSIYYTDHFEAYKYTLKKDSVFITYPDFVLAGRIGFSGDTLVIISDNGESRFYKFNK